jgi:hypothetical protein
MDTPRKLLVPARARPAHGFNGPRFSVCVPNIHKTHKTADFRGPVADACDIKKNLG